MTVGEINKGAVIFIIFAVLAGSGYLWWSKMYKPAVAARAVAAQAATTAESGLTQARTELEAAQKRVEEAKLETSKPDDAVGRLAKATAAVPKEKLLDDAAIVLMSMADRSGINTNFSATDSAQDAAASTTGSTLNGAVPVDIEFEAAGTYAEMMQFMSLVEGTVEVKDGKMYPHGRLFNVVKLKIGAPDEESSNSGGFDTEEADAAKPVLGPNDIQFTVTVRMYTTSDDNATSVGESTPDPAAAATTTDPSAAGATGTGAGTGTAGATDTAGGTTAPTTGDAGATGAAGGTAGDTGAAGGTGTPATTSTGAAA